MRRSPLRSPPRMRGKAVRADDAAVPAGITPAYAGKRRRRWASGSQDRDHPRVCGEKSAASIWAICARGSPPRVRGKVGAVVQLGARARITPACAGKSAPGQHPVINLRDHPRVCGEKLLIRPAEPVRLGSPPRMRGKAPLPSADSSPSGITPAYAGKSSGPLHRWSFCRDHPRVCGEKLKFMAALFSMWGSPPRVRGKAVPPRSAAANGCRGPSVPEYDAPP